MKRTLYGICVDFWWRLWYDMVINLGEFCIFSIYAGAKTPYFCVTVCHLAWVASRAWPQGFAGAVPSTGEIIQQQNARDAKGRCGRPTFFIRFLSAVASATNRAAGAMAEGDGFLPPRLRVRLFSVSHDVKQIRRDAVCCKIFSRLAVPAP